MPVLHRDRPTCDARSLGADCDNCPLNREKVRPVPSEVRPSKLVLVGEAPGTAEDVDGKPFAGKTGYWLGQQLRKLGLRRELHHVTNAVLCKPLPKMTKKLWNQAVKACRPRLLREVGEGRVVFAMGEWAYKGVGGRAEAFSKWRGAVQVIDGNTVIPYNHATFSAFYQPWHGDNFGRMLYRAAQLAAGQELRWEWPRDVIYPTEEAFQILERMRARAHQLPLGLDIENRFDGTITAIGIANAEEGVCLPWESYTARGLDVLGILGYGDIGRRCRDVVLDIIEKEYPKVLQNGTHDVLYLHRKGMWLGGFVRDTLLESVVIRPQLPHDLQYITAMEFPVDPWKASFHESELNKSTEDMNDLPEEDLRRYCLRDAFATAKLDSVLWPQLQASEPWRLERLEDLHEKALIGMRMRYYGWPTDRLALFRHRESQENIREQAATEIRELVEQAGYYEYLAARWLVLRPAKWKKKFGDVTPASVREHFPFNPGSDQQVAWFIYGCMKVAVQYTTEGGEPSTNDKALAETITWGGKVADFCKLLLRYRKADKIITTYLDNVPEKGRLFTIWKAHGTLTGRWSAGMESSSGRGFSVQTLPKALRNIFVAEDGSVLLCPDYSQLELRIVAMLAGDEDLIAAYARGEDIHLMNARQIFGKPDLTKDSPLRDTAKIVYGFNYGINKRAAWERLRADGVPVSEEFVAKIYDRWFELHPKIVEWQQSNLRQVRENMRITIPIGGQEIEFFGDPERDVAVTDTSNYPVQATGSRIVDRAFKAIAREVGWSRERHLVAHVHDEIVLCTNQLEKDAEIMQRHMHYVWEYGGHRMEFPVEFKVGRNYGKYHKEKNPDGLKGVEYEDLINGRW